MLKTLPEIEELTEDILQWLMFHPGHPRYDEGLKNWYLLIFQKCRLEPTPEHLELLAYFKQPLT